MPTANTFSKSDIPLNMQAITIKAFGSWQELELVKHDIPAIQAGELLIKVEAAGVNRPDILQRRGHYPAPKGASQILGLEIAGIVVAKSSSADKYNIGDEICGLVAGGGYAQYATIHQDTALPIPKGLNFIEAASLPETYFTVWNNMIDRAALKDGETILIHGGTSGIGVAAIQIARQYKFAKIFATAASEAKCTTIRSLEATAINYLTQDYVATIKAETAGKGADVILDMVGGDYVNRNIQVAAKDGRIVNIAYLNGSIAEVDFMPVMLKRLTLTGSTLRNRPLAEKDKIASALHKNIWPLIEAGKIKPIIDNIFSLKDAGLAHKYMEGGSHIGKLILTTAS
ncbi:MAG: NAD(P)H-quinone oxidoreductase [Hyphomicrobiales bacterium]|nr:NAD(P)H-quinone oxidoreductase [Hyphomicrobiales bacterium]